MTRNALKLFAACAALMIGVTAARAAPPSHRYFAYVGTYTAANSKGIYGYRFDARTGRFDALGVMAELPNPSFLATDLRHRVLYASTEKGTTSPEGQISSYAIDPRTGALRLLNRVAAGGDVTAHLAVDHTAKRLFVANYGSGSVVSFGLRPDGSIGAPTGRDQHSGSSVDPRRQQGPHPHAVVLSPDNRFLFVPDLGLDKIMSYRIDHAAFTPNSPAFTAVRPGLGPRHLVFGKDARFAYAVCEMGSSVVTFSYDRAKGELTPLQTISTLPPDFTAENNSAEIAIDRSGRFLYASNRGHDSITMFRIDARTGLLEKRQVAPTGGKIPRNFVIDPTGKYLLAANQNSNTITVLAIDPETGILTPTDTVLDAPSPVSILFVPEEKP